METDKVLAAINHLTVQPTGKEIVKFKPTENGDENEFTKALQHQPIVKSTIQEIKGALKIVMLKVGIKENDLPTEEEKAVLIDHILLNYGNHTPAEIKLAFDMALAGKLEDINHKGEPIELDVACYFGNFTCLYFSKIMNAYRMWAKQTYKQLKMEQQIPMEEMETIDVVDMIATWKNDPKLNMLLIPLFFYDFLKDTDMISLTDEQKWEWWRKGKESIKADLISAIQDGNDKTAAFEWKEFQECEQTKKWNYVMNERISARAKRLIVYEYLTRK